MKRLMFAAIIPFFLTGCVNKCGVSTSYEYDCKEYYDAVGIYHKECPKNNILDWCRRSKASGECLGCR